ncbi:hypothetical protein [Methylotetracoccus oryzae]|uniref:hypothetical protein n=1 Tax=Methylotetracoccus oryzae TaxID=1919059 RepID=UPI00111B6386|nr:hypothetical protein [Methylotetracoccus oryzae]
MKDFPGAWILLIGGLFAIQTWVVPAVINGATGTTLMKGTPEEGGSSLPVSNTYTDRAFAVCNHHVESSDSSTRARFATSPDKSWDIGFGRYIVQASVAVGDEIRPQRRDYVCRVHFAGGDEQDPGNWTVDGLEFSQP